MPGPTIEAERGWPVRVEWRNELDGALPVVVTVAPAETDGDGVPVQCLPGLSGGVADRHAAALTGFTVVHLHGGLTPAAYDGWTENVSAPGQHAVSDYPMDQRAALLWYHDHVLGSTRFTVYAGLAGLWIVRDGRERELDLPEGPPFEVPMLLQDRNFGQDPDGRLTGELVHKTDPGTMEAFAPLTVVNGKVWSVLDVQAGHLPAARDQRVQRAHVPPGAGAGRPAGARSDHADRVRRRSVRSIGGRPAGRVGTRVRTARGPAR